MERYSNLNGDSGVVGYEIGAGSTVVEFKDHSQYLYDSTRPGAPIVAELQKLARAGRGLNSYIGRVVRKNYARQIR